MNFTKNIIFLLFSFYLHSAFSFIIDGDEVKSTRDYPFIVKLLPVGCAGVIINRGWVLTAAHCKMGINNVLVGQIDLSKEKKNSQLFGVANRIIHPDTKEIKYSNFSPINYDFQLLRLKKNLDFNNDNISKITLASKSESNTYLVHGEILKVIGWGATLMTGYGSSDVLNELDVPFVNYSESNKKDAYDGAIDSKTMIAAGYMNGGKDSCHGDSGGPLFKMINGENKLFGIVSGGKGCAKKNKPGVYGKVSSALSWIKETIESEYSCGNINVLFLDDKAELRFKNKSYSLYLLNNRKRSKVYANKRGVKIILNKETKYLRLKLNRKKYSCYLDQYKFTDL